ncbi:MAG: transglutaminase domain-containing protein [Planctomycetota bacterium]|nr:MAG: transglutaminase domain-containing protein [Planctomycetota bacterium]
MKLQYLLGICLVLVISGLPRFALGETEYFAVFMEGKKVGYSIQSRVVSEGIVTTAAEVSITVSRADVPMSMNIKDTSIETMDGKPLGFELVQDFGIMAAKVVGIVDERGVVGVTTTSMGMEQKSEFEWPGGAVMAEGLRLLQLKQGLKEGTSYTAKVFEPTMLQAIDAEIRIGPKRNVDMFGRVVALTEVTIRLLVPMAGEITMTRYVDDELRVQKSVEFAAGIQIEMIACGKEFALGENDVFEFVDKMVLSAPAPLSDLRSAKSVSYHLSPSWKGGSFTIPGSDNQRVWPVDGGKVVVTVEPLAAPRRAGFPYRGRDKEILEAMKATRFLQSDSEEIKELARRAVGTTKDAGEAVKRIESFVGEYITEKTFSVGYASAAEVAASRVGDCSEHAVLVAAMCRAVRIPARVVSGIVYTDEFGGREDVFVGHAWVESYIGDKWVGLDASGVAGGYGAGHIALASGNGNPEDFLGLISSLGRFKIDEVMVNKGR